MRQFQVSQTLKMGVPNEVIPIKHYLRQPQRLVQAITDPSRIQQLAPSHFRLQLRPLKFMMLRFEPTVDLQVWTDAEGELHLRALDCEIRGAQFLRESFSLELAGTLSPHRRGRDTELRGKADLKIQVEVPPPLKLIPESVLENSGRTFLKGILLTIKYRLERQLVQDYERWVRANLAQPNSLFNMSLESSAS
ncbi:MAG: DUF1997 domain-containing protein [Xenococcaceae cyanobacterium MO_167.B52]|nr:DUF1997 domain-containing protein [Xenococcaceae cyanobacterium MO_167.B52]